MRAAVITRPGGPEVLEVREVPDPVPGEGEVLLEVAATAPSRGTITSAPRSRTAWAFRSVRTVPIGRAPSSRDTWIAAVPTPPRAARTSITSPSARRVRRASDCHAVRNTSGTAAASTRSMPSGTGISWPAGTAVS